MLDKYIIKKLLIKSNFFLLEYCLENRVDSLNTYFVNKKVGLFLGYNIKYFPLLMSNFKSQQQLNIYLTQKLNINFVLVKIDLVYIKSQKTFYKYIQNKFYIQQFINLIMKINYFLFKIFNLK